MERSLGESRLGWGRRLWIWIRVPATVLAAAIFLLIAVVAWLFVSQHSMIYHPRPYSAAYDRVLPPNGVRLDYVVPFGRQTAYYIPAEGQIPQRVWIAFCGNGSLALDWTGMFRGYPANGDAFLLVDYPGYGRNSGYATVDTTRTTANAALSALARRLGVDERRLIVCVIGHSLGAAAALDLAAHRPVQRIVLISPFTTLREEAAQLVGNWVSRVVVDNYDNRENLRTVLRNNRGARVAIFHGTDDEDIPVWMGKELKQQFPAIDFFPVEGADHVTVMTIAHDQIVQWMTR
jgi:pimeloyl-ACP methyl ester carboxylesterase